MAEAVRNWINAVGAKTAYIELDSPWENGYCESFNARVRDDLLNGKIFYSLKEAQIIIEKWRRHYNTKRPHSALGYRPPDPGTIVPMKTRPVMHQHFIQWGPTGFCPIGADSAPNEALHCSEGPTLNQRTESDR